MYGILGRTINRKHGRHLRPFYEEMKRAYMRSRKHRGKGREEGEPKATGE